MRNVNVVIKPDETINDIIAQICQIENIKCDDPFAFSCIMTREDEGYNKLKINCLEPAKTNPYSPVDLVVQLFEQPSEKEVKYVVPPLEQYLTVFKPSLWKMVNRAHPYYMKLIPDKEDLMSILGLTIVRLKNKGYYLHKHLIYKAFINALNMEVRKSKYFDDILSLDKPIAKDDEGEAFTLMDKIEDKDLSREANQKVHYTEQDYDEDLYNGIKNAMIEDMGQFAFDRIMIKIKSQTIDSRTSRILSKYREEFNPGYVPRPNAKGKSKGGIKNG